METEILDMGLNMSELKELYALNQEKMASLKEDIKQCQDKLKLFGPEVQLAQELRLIQRSDGSTNVEQLKERFANDIIMLEGRVKETAKLTGITIAGVEEITEMGEESTKQTIDLSLEILGRDVKLRCEVDDDLTVSGQEMGRRVVSWLEVKIEKEINDVIGDALAKSTKQVAVHSVLSLIKSYLQCLNERDRLITHFTQTFPDTVSHWVQCQTHRLKITSAHDTRHPTFTLEWEVQLQASTGYTNHVTLQVDASSHLKSLDTKGILESAAAMFSHLTETLGLEQAISSFIGLVDEVTHSEDIDLPAL